MRLDRIEVGRSLMTMEEKIWKREMKGLKQKEMKKRRRLKKMAALPLLFRLLLLQRMKEMNH